MPVGVPGCGRLRHVSRGDGRLTHDLLPGEKAPQDACGVFGVWAPGEDVAKLTYFGLYALQHRGQESAGIASSDGHRLLVYKDMGLVSQVFDEASLGSLKGHLAIGHCRYSTTGGSTWENAQPTLGGTDDSTVALAHNGNLINSAELRDLLFERHGDAFAGQLGGEVQPGEFIAIDEDGLRSHQFVEPDPKGCVFEYVYLARPDATIAGRSVHEARVEMGRRLATEYPVEADLVIPVPESGTPAAIGYAEASGIPYGQGFVKNSYVGRTFIHPSHQLQQLGIRLKLNALETVIRGKRLVVVDDSIVRGNTQRAQIRMLREAGAAEIHVRISSPPVKWPCFYGIDFATRAELVATGLKVEEIRASIGADSLGYLREDAMIEATEQPRERLCTACFTGDYPIALPDSSLLGKQCLEVLPGLESPSSGGLDVEGVSTGVAGGAADALSRP